MNAAQNLVTDLMYNRNGRFVTVTFLKNNGEPRTLNGRLHVEKWLTKGLDPQAGDTDRLVTIWDRQAMGYRRFNLSKLISIRAEGLHIEANPKSKPEGTIGGIAA